MLCRALVPALALTLAAAAAARADVIERSFEVAPGGTLTLTTDRGDVTVTAVDGTTVRVRVERLARAGSSVEDHQVAFEPSGSDLTVRGETARGGLWGWRSVRLGVRYAVEVPRRYHLELDTAGGDVSVGPVEGELRAETSGGDVTLGEIAGPVWAHSSGGDVRLEGATEHARLETSGGDVEIGAVEGPVEARTSGGDIRIERARGDVDAETSGGDIEIEELFGAIQAHTSGGDVVARLAVQPQSNCRLSTSGGDVVVQLADSIAVEIDASSSGGSVSVEMPVTVSGTLSRGRLEATLGSGGPLLHLRTSGGDIEIRKLAPTNSQDAS
ncbi:MAG: DUF4097 family beta strand repeat-containing protein [Thermoanaerobaculia bacterium]